MSRILKNLNALAICMAILLPFTLAACGKTLDWSQEALLHDGRTLWVERHSERGSPFPGNSGLEIGQTLAFRHPDTGARIEWRIPDGLQPVMIDFDHGVPYYVLVAYTVSDYSKWGCPNPPYLVYRYQQGKWVHVAFESLPAPFVNRNLLEMSKTWRGLEDGSRVSAEQMEGFWQHAEFNRKKGARVISREKINPIVKGCAESVLFALGRETEMDEKSRRGYMNQLEKMPDTARAQYHDGMEKLRKELKEKQP